VCSSALWRSPAQRNTETGHTNALDSGTGWPMDAASLTLWRARLTPERAGLATTGSLPRRCRRNSRRCRRNCSVRSRDRSCWSANSSAHAVALPQAPRRRRRDRRYGGVNSPKGNGPTRWREPQWSRQRQSCAGFEISDAVVEHVQQAQQLQLVGRVAPLLRNREALVQGHTRRFAVAAREHQ
jgi:hypothetical protein